jgi:hypothetical protein
MPINQTYLEDLLLHGSQAFRAANPALVDRSTGKTPKLERTLGHGTLGEGQIQTTTGSRFLVCIASFRKRLLDQDNLAEKYHVDLCRYAGALPSDAPGSTQIETRQIKVGKGEAERVKIEVWKLS